jgi:hypothetical protein
LFILLLRRARRRLVAFKDGDDNATTGNNNFSTIISFKTQSPSTHRLPSLSHVRPSTARNTHARARAQSNERLAEERNEEPARAMDARGGAPPPPANPQQQQHRDPAKAIGLTPNWRDKVSSSGLLSRRRAARRQPFDDDNDDALTRPSTK